MLLRPGAAVLFLRLQWRLADSANLLIRFDGTHPAALFFFFF
jgi:hypothetical protein